MPKKSLANLTDLAGKKVVIRVDFNVPQDKDGTITNDRRIRGALPTIQYVLEKGGSAILISHLGRPTGDAEADKPFRMDRVATRLGELLGKPVQKSDEVVGPISAEKVAALKPGEVLLLENVRFHPDEQNKKHDGTFAKTLASYGDVYVNDAFGTCHRKDVSMLALPEAMKGKPRVVGFLVAKELDILANLLGTPKRPMVGLLGGGKVSDKIGFIKAMLARVDQVLVGGAMTYTFLKAQGIEIGSSRCEADKLDLARELLELGKGKIVLPVDHLIADKVAADATTEVSDGQVPAGKFGLDIGPKTIQLYSDIIAKAGTVVWNGPMGKFEDEPFAKGTKSIGEAMAANQNAVTVVGGGETAEAVEQFGLDSQMTHVSTGGGAFLEYVEGTPFAALDQIDDQ
ncbi:phosphoglycerate kinase [Tuwongella immobilis]|uniref:Phosphoglycerate kinase n=1 Tax=Tuwongella immobilis TaxID=692036 RepID=A0A6C2YKZ4_9BACT|nr:phosphoglycerate kinase [Tuwongella immobilis]VIP01971.1 phosphoglycerate kinase : Phosphoglycerate kinase OS=Isosphaera pallida (strain ATCC 43644 / DSM 9630 / IS1B) GN=pgk PE=3 SV=1: PGK [Tuwongella immobilis]VTR99999.1 phosphoglycerate kinase : Phosphoglycerate kinase OS=Isosphaera pallida (strain ATCC 43644 / DSM 9630 / IS1B) GN=pgk PE=3 SV=1: PGK [Tuwongella immobilis]